MRTEMLFSFRGGAKSERRFSLAFVWDTPPGSREREPNVRGTVRKSYSRAIALDKSKTFKAGYKVSIGRPAPTMEHGRMEITVLQSALQVLQVCASLSSVHFVSPLLACHGACTAGIT